MNRLLFIAAILGPACAWGQPVPDTTGARRYFPLHVGDEWQYLGYTDWSSPSEWVERRGVVGDTVLLGERYFLYRRERFDPTTWMLLEPPQTYPIRVGVTSDAIEVEGGDPNVVLWNLQLITCPLSAPFDAVLSCPGVPYVTTGGGPQTLIIGGDAIQTTVKWFDTQGFELATRFASDIGYVGFQTFGGHLVLEYALVADETYGSPIVAAEPAPRAIAPALTVAPNPAADRATLSLDLPQAGAVTLEVFDVLGRRVFGEELALAAGRLGLQVDVSDWNEGAYVVRASGGEWSASTILAIR